MGKLLSKTDLDYLDNLILELRKTSEPELSETKVKKACIHALDANDYSKNWKFTTKYAALKYLKFV